MSLQRDDRDSIRQIYDLTNWSWQFRLQQPPVSDRTTQLVDSHQYSDQYRLNINPRNTAARTARSAALTAGTGDDGRADS